MSLVSTSPAFLPWGNTRLRLYVRYLPIVNPAWKDDPAVNSTRDYMLCRVGNAPEFARQSAEGGNTLSVYMEAALIDADVSASQRAATSECGNWVLIFEK